MSTDLVGEYLREQDQIPFAWGSADCVHFVAGLHGVSLDEYRYSSEREALELIASSGGLRVLISRKIGEPQIVRRGGLEIASRDIVLATYASIGEIVGLASPPVAWYRQPGRRGLFPAPLEQCLYFWRL
jgi:hypothetical protein